jgi:hypothetical protein
MYTLTVFLCMPFARPLRQLSIPEAGLTDEGLCCAAAILSSSASIESLNIVKNKFSTNPERSWAKRAFRGALQSNSSLKYLSAGQCGLSATDKLHWEHSRKSRSQPAWSEAALFTYFIGREFNTCRASYYELSQVMLNLWQSNAPAKWPSITIEPIPAFVQLESHLASRPYPIVIVTAAKYSDRLAAGVRFLEQQEEKCNKNMEQLHPRDRGLLNVESEDVAR